MTNGTASMSNEDYPLSTLHPVADGKHRWSGLLVQCNGDGDHGRHDLAALVQLFGEFGLFESLGNLPCVMPLRHPGLLDDELAESLPAERVALRIPAAQITDAANAAVLDALRGKGFRLIVDGLPAAGTKLPESAQSIAVDFSSGCDIAAARIWMGQLPGPHLALNVDEVSGYEGARGTGFRWIAGNYPLNPGPVKSTAASPGRSTMLKLLAQITGDADSRDIEATLKQDPNLSYQLLKLVNSVAFSMTNKISSFSQAITMLGRRQLQRWLQLLLYARPPGKGDEASPLMPRAAMRAGLMEGLARAAGLSKDGQDRAFMVGMFSLLEPLVGQPAVEVIKPLNLSEEVTIALIARQGQLGAFLAAIEAGEEGPTARTAAALAEAGVAAATWATEQAQACHWAIQISREA